MIEFRGVTYYYPNKTAPALRDVSLKIQAGRLMLLIGPSGAGKSTLLRCLNGLVPHFYGGAFHGQVRVEGRDPVALGPRGMSDVVGFVFQDPESQFVTQLVEDELAFAMENHNFDQPLMRRRIEEVLDQLSIADLRTRRVQTLSGGQQQLVAIASALTLQPSILVLDEPTSQLDPQAAEEVLTILQKLNQDYGLTIILSEHRLERVAQYADEICYLPGSGAAPVIGDPRSVLAHADLAPPLVHLGRRLSWQPLPLTIKEGRQFLGRLHRELGDASLASPATTRPLAQSGEASLREPALTVQGLSYSYNGRQVLNGVGFAVHKGEMVAVMGRNGAGKSTLLKNIVGLLKPSRGKVQVLGMDVGATDLADITRHVGFLPQDPGRLLFKETLAQELQFTCESHGMSLDGISSVLNDVGLGDQSQAYPRDLSTGERQRAALAAILVAQPQIVLLDEPTRGLDYLSKERLVTILADLRKRGTTIVLVTHDVELVAQCADRVIILGDGQVVTDASTRAVMTDSMVFASQINKLMRDRSFLTVADVLDRLQDAQGPSE